MIDTEELGPDEIEALNGALRYAKVTQAEVILLAKRLRLGDATVKRWFDSTNKGDYSPAIGADAVGKEDYLLQDNGDTDIEEYEESPTAYKGDPYLDGQEQFDTEENIDSDEGITDLSEASLHQRLLLAALVSGEGYTREKEVGVTFTGKSKSLNLPTSFSTLPEALEAADNIITGGYSRYITRGWNALRVTKINGGWLLECEYWDRVDTDPSP